jgi:hypothetical protein
MKDKKRLVILGLLSIIIYVLFLFSDTSISNQMSTDSGLLIISEVIPNNQSLKPDGLGNCYDIIEIYNPSNYAIDLTGMGLSDDPSIPHLWTFDNGTIKPDEYLIVYAAGIKDSETSGAYYTSFKLDAKGERIALSDVNGNIVSSVSYGNLDNNMSLAFIDDEYHYILEGTPGAVNKGVIITDMLEFQRKLTISPSHGAGIYEKPIVLTFSTIEGYEIRYTLDGSDPGSNSIRYDRPIRLDYSVNNPTRIANIKSTFDLLKPIEDDFINKGTVVKARVFNGLVPIGDMFVSTYFIWEEGIDRYSLDVVSLTTDPSNMYNQVDGIYVVGYKYQNINGNVTHGETPANYNQRGIGWEREANIELFDNAGSLAFDQNIGIRIFGRGTRTYPKKSFKLYARKAYDGVSTFDYSFFENMEDIYGNDIETFQNILLRSGGNDYDDAFFRDLIVGKLIETLVDVQAAKPVVLFINGEYWGLYNIREHMNEDYISSHYLISTDEINIVEIGMRTFESYHGDEAEIDRYNDLLAFVDEKNLSIQENFDYLSSRVDMDNLTDYYITQIFINNTDWPGNNTRIWRYTGVQGGGVRDGKYRYQLYDTDFGYGLMDGYAAASHNSFKFLYEDFKTWPNPKWTTTIFRNAMENDSFKQQFIMRFTDLLNSRFEKNEVLEVIESLEKTFEPEMEEYINRYNFTKISDVQDWEEEISIIEDFATNRGDYLLKFAQEHYDLGNISELVIESIEHAEIQVNNDYTIYSENMRGTEDAILKYYADYPVTFKVNPSEGYAFVRWQIESEEGYELENPLASGDIYSREIQVKPIGDLLIQAIVEKKD